jgi:hypothetical protein
MHKYILFTLLSTAVLFSSPISLEFSEVPVPMTDKEKER